MWGLPHVCGGVSGALYSCTFFPESSPCIWGCFQRSGLGWSGFSAFPMYMGVFPLIVANVTKILGLPHVCGGVSIIASKQNQFYLSSPCMWGCFSRGIGRKGTRWVFPMYVGVFPSQL